MLYLYERTADSDWLSQFMNSDSLMKLKFVARHSKVCKTRMDLIWSGLWPVTTERRKQNFRFEIIVLPAF